jgi:hypothetical protein
MVARALPPNTDPSSRPPALFIRSTRWKPSPVSDAGAKNLHLTSRRLEDIVDESNASRPKAICFVTGVPGAGKTLVGLNIATRRREEDQPTHAVFLSGNGPLVAVLREALTAMKLPAAKLPVRK